MKTAAVAISPVDGGKVKSVDETDARKIPGVIDVLHIDDAVAVVGEHYGAARAGLEALDIGWAVGPNAKLPTASIRADAATAADQRTPTNSHGPHVAARAGSPARSLPPRFSRPARRGFGRARPALGLDSSHHIGNGQTLLRRRRLAGRKARQGCRRWGLGQPLRVSSYSSRL